MREHHRSKLGFIALDDGRLLRKECLPPTLLLTAEGCIRLRLQWRSHSPALDGWLRNKRRLHLLRQLLRLVLLLGLLLMLVLLLRLLLRPMLLMHVGVQPRQVVSIRRRVRLWNCRLSNRLQMSIPSHWHERQLTWWKLGCWHKRRLL